MSKQPAYLVIHKIAWYNDEFYQDFSSESEIANPAALFTTREEAQQHALHQTRQAMKGKDAHELMLDEDASMLLSELMDDEPDVEPGILPALKKLADGHSLPRNLTDEQADAIAKLLNLNLYHVLETELEPAQVQEGQNLLSQTPQRPPVYPGFDPEGEMVFGDLDDPVIARLERITQLFGRHYATEELN